MRHLKILLAVLLFLVNFAVISPALADRIAKKSPEYPEIVQTLNNLLEVQKNPEQTEYTAQELQQRIADTKLQKYVLETSEDWGVCRNETGKLLAIYAHKAKKSTPNTLFYLANGEETDDEWDCDGVYLPGDAKIAQFNRLEGEPLALKIVDGTQLVVTTNPQTGEIELNTPSALIAPIPTSEKNWQIPNLTQADIDLQAPNAPVD